MLREQIHFMDKFNHAALSEKFMQMLFVTHYNFFRQTAIPIPANHFGVLLILSDHGPSTVSDLCIYLRMSKQQMTPIINKLAKNDLLSKSKPPADRRCTLLTMTEKGQAILDSHRAKLRERFEQGLARLPAKDSQVFGSSMDTFTTTIQKMFPLQPSDTGCNLPPE